jgi:hypothetical protein
VSRGDGHGAARDFRLLRFGWLLGILGTLVHRLKLKLRLVPTSACRVFGFKLGLRLGLYVRGLDGLWFWWSEDLGEVLLVILQDLGHGEQHGLCASEVLVLDRVGIQGTNLLDPRH